MSACLPCLVRLSASPMSADERLKVPNITRKNKIHIVCVLIRRISLGLSCCSFSTYLSEWLIPLRKHNNFPRSMQEFFFYRSVFALEKKVRLPYVTILGTCINCLMIRRELLVGLIVDASVSQRCLDRRDRAEHFDLATDRLGVGASVSCHISTEQNKKVFGNSARSVIVPAQSMLRAPIICVCTSGPTCVPALTPLLLRNPPHSISR